MVLPFVDIISGEEFWNLIWGNNDFKKFILPSVVSVVTSFAKFN
jgi:hypothetical protein